MNLLWCAVGVFLLAATPMNVGVSAAGKGRSGTELCAQSYCQCPEAGRQVICQCSTSQTVRKQKWCRESDSEWKWEPWWCKWEKKRRNPSCVHVYRLFKCSRGNTRAERCKCPFNVVIWATRLNFLFESSICLPKSETSKNYFFGRCVQILPIFWNLRILFTSPHVVNYGKRLEENVYGWVRSENWQRAVFDFGKIKPTPNPILSHEFAHFGREIYLKPREQRPPVLNWANL